MTQKALQIIFALLLSFAHLAANKPIKVACVGNSITAGYLLKDSKKDSYPSVLQRLLGDKYQVGNFGHSGATLLNKGHRPYTKTEEFKAAVDFNADIIIIHLGLNDTDPRNWAHYRDEFLSDYNKLIDTLTHRDPKKRVLIAQMSPVTVDHRRYASSTRVWYDQVQEAIKTVAEVRRIELMDLRRPLYHYTHLFPDALHPVEEGAERLAKYVHQYLTGDWGGLRMSDYYADGMVLQRGRHIRIVGQANAKERIRVTPNKGKSYLALANEHGHWSVLLDSLSTEKTHTLTIKGEQKTLVYNNVLVGDVWLASGQSNMAWRLNGTKDHGLDQLKEDDKLRMFDMRPIRETLSEAWAIEVLDKVNNFEYYNKTSWSSATDRETVGGWSAVAYHFARQLRDSLDVPIAIIQNAIGGSAIESWVSQRSLEVEIPEMLSSRWRGLDYSMDWVRQRAGENIKLREKAQRHPYDASYLYTAAIEPLKGQGIKGVIWYQGESNANNAELYARLFTMMTQDWRKLFGPNTPFYSVQLPGIASRPSWSEFRLVQDALTGKGIHIVPTYDYGDEHDVHPQVKRPVGERLARIALQQTYNRADAYKQSKIESLTLEKKGSRFYLKNGNEYVSNSAKGASTAEALTIGFEFAGADRVYKNVDVRTDEKTGHLYIEREGNGDFIDYRYAYHHFTRANLYNSYGIPYLPSRGKVQYEK